MPVKVKCTQCEKALLVPDTARGKAIKCPQCQTRIAVPAEDDSSKAVANPKAVAKTSAAAAKPKAKKAQVPIDSEHALASFDMRRAEDTEARICPKCGFDKKYQDEEDNECPQCGFDTDIGGMGAKARKKALKGPDPADFYPGLFKQSWGFVARNYKLAWRTVVYTLVSLSIALLCAFLFLYVATWPPRAFFALCFTISFFVVPGWMWVLDTEVIKLTLERKDKFKKLNFDFFLASAMGAAFTVWLIVVALPMLLLPAGIGYLLVNYGGMPNYALAICVAIGAVPIVWMFPVVMAHMSMPVQYKGWMFWKLVPLWIKNIKPLSIWLMFFLFTNIPNLAGLAVIGAVYGPQISNIATIMEYNAAIERERFNREQNPNTKKKGQLPVAKTPLPDPEKYDLKPVIVPCIILAVMCLINGWTCMFNMRTNGQLIYYNKGTLDLIDRLKEKKYVAKERVSDDDDEKPKTPAQIALEGAAISLIFGLLGLVGGMLYGNMTDVGMLKGLLAGGAFGFLIANFVVWIMCVRAGFQNSALWGSIILFTHPIGTIVFATKNLQERQLSLYQAVFASLLVTLSTIAATVFEAFPWQVEQEPAPVTRIAPPADGIPPQGGPPGRGGPPGQGGPPNQGRPPGQNPPGQQPGGVQQGLDTPPL